MNFFEIVDDYLYRSEYFTTFEVLKSAEEMILISDISKIEKGEVKND